MEEQRERGDTMRWELKNKEGKGIKGTCGGRAKRTKGYNEVGVEEKREKGNPGRIQWRSEENKGVE